MRALWLTNFLLRKLGDLPEQRKPDFIIDASPKESVQEPYLLRWYIPPFRKSKWLSTYFHIFLRSDDDRALHDHVSFNISIILKGEYTEILGTIGGTTRSVIRRQGEIVFRRKGSIAHRVVLHSGPATTFFITGYRYRNWGFWCPRGWIPWQEFTGQNDSRFSGEGGRGPDCD